MAQQKKKSSTGTRNADRRSGKAWKDGKSPAAREQIAKKAANAKRERKSIVAIRSEKAAAAKTES